MKDYSPKRRTALVLTGSGTSGAYHAGVLKALDESGLKVDLVVGSGAGAVAAAFAAVAEGPRLYGPGGFWDGVEWRSLYALRPGLRAARALIASSFAVFLLPLLVALVLGILFPLLLLVDLLAPGTSVRLFAALGSAPELLRAPYLALLAAPILALCVAGLVALGRLYLRDRRRSWERLESALDPRPGLARLHRLLWEAARGSVLAGGPPPEPELGKRYVTLATENLGQPGFRELILRVADLETGGPLSFLLLGDAARGAYRGRGALGSAEVDLRAPGYEPLVFDAVATGLLPPLIAPVRRVSFPRGGPHAGETHRLTDASLVAGCGIGEALKAGAEQVIVVAALPEEAPSVPRRRGLFALADGVVATLERQAVEQDLKTAERLNRVVETLGHATAGGDRAWEDPASGRLFTSASFYVIRPNRRSVGPLELDGAVDPATEVAETPADLLEQGYRDAYRCFLEPVLGSAPEPARPAVERERHAVQL